jgi:hypothetical protein
MNENEMVVYDLKGLSKVPKLSIRTLRKHIKRGKLRAKKIGRAYYVTHVNLTAFLEHE